MTQSREEQVARYHELRVKRNKDFVERGEEDDSAAAMTPWLLEEREQLQKRYEVRREQAESLARQLDVKGEQLAQAPADAENKAEGLLVWVNRAAEYEERIERLEAEVERLREEHQDEVESWVASSLSAYEARAEALGQLVQAKAEVERLKSCVAVYEEFVDKFRREGTYEVLWSVLDSQLDALTSLEEEVSDDNS